MNFWILSISHFSVSDKTASYTGLEEICIERFGNAALMFSRLSLLFYSFKLILYTCLSMWKEGKTLVVLIVLITKDKEKVYWQYDLVIFLTFSH